MSKLVSLDLAGVDLKSPGVLGRGIDLNPSLDRDFTRSTSLFFAYLAKGEHSWNSKHSTARTAAKSFPNIFLKVKLNDPK